MALKFVHSWRDADAITHGGNFHADDIFSIAVLDYIFHDLKINRLTYEEELKAKPLPNQIWFDIGGGVYDHHQRGGNGIHKKIDNNKKSIPNASFGLIWNSYGLKYCSKFFSNYKDYDFYNSFLKGAYDYIEYNLVRAIDASDNGIFPVKPDNLFEKDQDYRDFRPLTISFIISQLNPNDDEIDDNYNLGLFEAIYFAENAIKTLLNKYEESYLNEGATPFSFDWIIDDEYIEIITRLVKEKFGLSSSNPTSKEMAVFPDDDLNVMWYSCCDKICNEKYSENPGSANKSITGLVNGFSADMHGIRCKVRNAFDFVNFLTISAVFGDKRLYFGNFEDDLTRLIGLVLDRFIEYIEIKVKSSVNVKNDIFRQKGRILVLDKKAYWTDLVATMPEAQKFWFVVSPTSKGLWKVCPIRSKKTKNGFRKGFPSAWRGLRREELQKERNIRGVAFIHDSGIMALCDNFSSAIRLCKKAYGNTENNT